jgi:hypothetical protein
MAPYTIRTELDDDLIAVEQRAEIRLIVNLPGRYSLSSKRDANGERRLFACRALNLSPLSALLSAPVIGPLGERVIATLDHVGKFSGKIVRVLDRGFVMSIVGTGEERGKLAAKLLWFDKFKNHDATDGRAHGRMLPRSPNSTITLTDGSTFSCLVIDMSVSGAAVSADLVPQIGTVLAVGAVVGRVVRRFAEGFAVRFTELQSLQALEDRLIRQ